VSVVTVVYNGASTLERTILSVLGQTYAPIEYIIVDGGSTDGTLAIIRRFEARLARWLSEPDNGISDAFNKGIGLATGDYVALINADDWMEPDQIARGVAALEADQGAAYAFGDCIVTGLEGETLYRINGNPHYAAEIAHRMPELAHPSVLARRSAYARFGGFDRDLRYAMDYEWLLRLHVQGAHGTYVPGMVAHMSQGGESDSGHRQALLEVEAASVRHGYPAWRARALFWGRLAKGVARRWLERSLPGSVRDLPRRLVNRHVVAAD
jgi:glycosyltransferase involved in cell wall biosynthesis